MAIFDRNNFREKTYVSAETIRHTCGYQILVLFIVLRFCCLPVNWTGSWIFLVSCNISLPLSKLTFPIFFSQPSDLELLKNENYLFSKTKQGKVEQLEINFKAISTVAHLWTIFMVVAMWTTKITRHIQTTNHRSLSNCHCLPSLHLKILQARHLKIFLTGCLQNSETGIMVCSNHLTIVFVCLFLSIEMSLIK